MRITRLMIERFRGLELLVWDPAPGVNCLVGPADAGKTTVLAAIETLLASWQPTVFEFDYWRRRVERGFQISAVLVDLPDDFVSSFRVPPLHGWANGQLVDLPEAGALPAVYAVARGLPDLEVEHALIDPSGAESRFTIGHRRQMRATRLNWDRTDAELRLGRGSLLQQHLGGQPMRSLLTGALAETSERLQLPAEIEARLRLLGDQYLKAGLPSDLQLGLQSPRRESLLGLLGLLQGPSHSDAVPLSLAGAGTKRLAAFELAAALGAETQTVLVDEPEVGLEPYRQRRLVARLRELISARGQAFLTTHSPAVLASLSSAEVVRLENRKCPSRLPATGLDRLIADDPEALLARLPVLCEGPTEAGVLSELLPHVGGLSGGGSLDALGVRLSARTGQPAVLNESRALATVGVEHGIFVDNENEGSGTRNNLASHRCVVLGTWRVVRNIEEAVATWLPAQHVEELFALVASFNQRPVDDLRQAVGDRLKMPGRRSFAELVAAAGEGPTRSALGDTLNRNGSFKTHARGAALGRFLIRVGVPEPILEVVGGFWKRLEPLVSS